MDNYKNLLEDPCINSYLAPIPQNLWNEAIRKALFFGISSLNALENINSSDMLSFHTKAIEKDLSDIKSHQRTYPKNKIIRKKSYPYENNENIQENIDLNLNFHIKSTSKVPKINKLDIKNIHKPRTGSFTLRKSNKDRKEELKTDREKITKNIKKNIKKNERKAALQIEKKNDAGIVKKNLLTNDNAKKNNLGSSNGDNKYKKQQKQYQILNELFSSFIPKQDLSINIDKLNRQQSPFMEKTLDLEDTTTFRYLTSSSEENE